MSTTTVHRDRLRIQQPDSPHAHCSRSNGFHESPISESRNSSWWQSLLAPVCGVTLIVLLAKLVGFGEKVVIAKYLGTSGAADCYYAAFSVVWAIVFVVRELVRPTLLPVYLTLRCEENHSYLSERLASAAGGSLMLILGILAIVLAAWPGMVVRLFVPGFTDEAKTETAGLVRTMSAGIAILTFTSVTKTLLDAHQRFCWSTLGELVFRVVFLCGLIAGFRLSMHGQGVGVSLALAASAGVILHLLVLRKHIRLRRPLLDASEAAAVRQMLLLATPLFVGVVFSHVGQLVDTVLASVLAPGRLSALTYAKKLTDAIVLMGPVALSTVMFSHFSSLAAEGRFEELRRRLRRCLAVLVAVSIPVAVIVGALRYPIVRMLFARGSFDAASTELTANALGCYGIGITAMAVESLVVSTFYAIKDMKTPTCIGVGSVLCDIALSWGLMQVWGYLGLPLAVSIVKSLKVLVLLAMLSARVSGVVRVAAADIR